MPRCTKLDTNWAIMQVTTSNRYVKKNIVGCEEERGARMIIRFIFCMTV